MLNTEEHGNEYNNFKNPKAGCDVWGDFRLKSAIFVKDQILNPLKLNWAIDNGTLLGAYRNGKFIPHDDDFDFAIFIESIEEIEEIFEKVKALVNIEYECRLIKDYCCKIEIFDPKHGSFSLGDKYQKYMKDGKKVDYYYVCCDLQFYLKTGQDTYNHLYFLDNLIDWDFRPANSIFPCGSIELEGETFICPRDIVRYLEAAYGSIDPKAKYNSKSNKYELSRK